MGDPAARLALASPVTSHLLLLCLCLHLSQFVERIALLLLQSHLGRLLKNLHLLKAADGR